MGDLSGLTVRLSTLLHRLGLADADDDELRARVQVHVDGHFLDSSTPEWMHDLLDDLLARRLTGEVVACPEGYPDGESGLMNVLLDLEQDFPLGIEDDGEEAFWPLPQLGVALVIQREGGIYCTLRPWDAGYWRERSPNGHLSEGTLQDGRPAGRWRHSSPNGGAVYQHDYGSRPR